jgi:hypothetical protein
VEPCSARCTRWSTVGGGVNSHSGRDAMYVVVDGVMRAEMIGSDEVQSREFKVAVWVLFHGSVH